MNSSKNSNSAWIAVSLKVMCKWLINTRCCCWCYFSHVWLFDSRDCSPQSSSVHEVFLAILVEWVATSSSQGSSRPITRRSLFIPYLFPDLSRKRRALVAMGSHLLPQASVRLSLMQRWEEEITERRVIDDIIHWRWHMPRTCSLLDFCYFQTFPSSLRQLELRFWYIRKYLYGYRDP